MKANLQTDYMGVTLKNPVVVSSSPLSQKIDNIRHMEDAGAGAVVLFSLFEEQIQQEMAQYDFLKEFGSECFAEALNYFPAIEDYPIGLDQYLELVKKAKEAVDIPIFASLNGITNTGWITYAQQLENAGADGLELNIFFIPANTEMDGRAVEQRYFDILKSVKSAIDIPVALKLNPYFSATAHMANALAKAGANALVLFNRFYEPDLDIERLTIEQSLELSNPTEIRLPLLWIAVLYGRINCSLAATTGVHSGKEIIKYLLAGADVVMTASALIKNGIYHLETMLADVNEWLNSRDLESLDNMRGLLSQKNIPDPTSFERANYIKNLEGYSKA